MDRLQYNVRGQLWDVRVSTNPDVNGSANRGGLQYFYDSSLGYATSGPDNNGNVLFANTYTPEDEQDIHWAITPHPGFVFLVAIIDWFSRFVLSWEVSIKLESNFCVAALDWTLQLARPDIFNMDQGAQFTSQDFTGRLLAQQIQISMDGRGRALDNIFDAPDFAAGALTHLITEYYEAQLLPVPMSLEAIYLTAHSAALEAESDTVGDLNGNWWQQPRSDHTTSGNFLNPPETVRFKYSTVEYDIVFKAGANGTATQVDKVTKIDKTPKPKKK